MVAHGYLGFATISHSKNERFALTTLLAVIAFFCDWSHASWRNTVVGLYGVLGRTISSLSGVASLSSNWGFFCLAVCRGRSGRMHGGPDLRRRPRSCRDTGAGAGPAPSGKHSRGVFLHRKECQRGTPELAARIAAEGHLLGNHTYHHARWTPFQGPAGLTQELAMTQDAIREATGITPPYIAPRRSA